MQDSPIGRTEIALPSDQPLHAPPGTTPPKTSSDRFTEVRTRGNVDYALRTLQQGLVHFSSMADTKANIMITVCSFVVTVSVTQWQDPFLRIPMMLLSASGVGALAFAVWTVKPALRRPRGPAGRLDPRGPEFNLLFFSHFATLTADEYLDAWEDLLKRDNGLYEAMVRDIHGQGSALARRKYRLLGYSYMTFLLGLGFTAAALILQSF